MTKNIEEIEKLLREEKLPDQDTGHAKPNLWQKILEEHRDRQKKGSPLFRIKPWLWSLASILLIIICLILMWLISGQK